MALLEPLAGGGFLSGPREHPGPAAAIPSDELVITEGTVRRHVSNVYQKIGANNRSEATGYGLSVITG